MGLRQEVYPDWYSFLFALNAKQRQEWVQEVINALDDKQILKFLKGPDCHIIGFAPSYEYLPLTSLRNRLAKFEEVVLVCRHKRMPVYMMIGATIDKAKVKDLKATNSGLTPKRYPHWYMEMQKWSPEKKKRFKDHVIRDVREAAKDTRNKGFDQFADFMIDKNRCQILGFAPNFEYLLAKNDGRAGWESSFIHAFGQVCLVMKQKDVPVVLMTGACLEWNKNEFGVPSFGVSR